MNEQKAPLRIEGGTGLSEMFRDAKELNLSRELAPPKNEEDFLIPPRMTVVDTIYHQLPGQEPFCYTSKFERVLSCDEQPYVRHTKVGEEWKPLDLGWLAGQEISAILLLNEEGQFHGIVPTEEEKRETAQKVLEVGFDCIPHWCIPPTESMRATPISYEGLRIRCRSGKARYCVCVIPS